MTHDEYFDLLKRIIGIADTIVEMNVSIGTIVELLVTKNICTVEELEEAKQYVYESDLIVRARQVIEERTAEIEELESKDPFKMIMDLVSNKKGE